MKRRITAFFQDAQSHWGARLECGHSRPVRHRPPWQNHPWVLTPAGRRAHLGLQMYCRLCVEGLPITAPAVPGELSVVSRTPNFTETTMPALLRERHILPAARYACVHVLRGQMQYRELDPDSNAQLLLPGTPVLIPPRRPHALEPLGAVLFYLELLALQIPAPSHA